MPFVRRQRKYYKDGVEVPSSSITDFGSTKYYKNIVTTKYWKEITTGSRELGYYCWKAADAFLYTKTSTPVKGDSIYSNDTLLGWFGTIPSSVDELKEFPKYIQRVGTDYVNINTDIMGGTVSTNYVRYPEGDLYIDTTVTETVEGTPEDYTYTTEEITPVEVDGYEDWQQPILTANNSDPNFVVSASSLQTSSSFQPWRSFKEDTTDYKCYVTSGAPTNENPMYYYITTDRPLKVSTITIKNRGTTVCAPIGIWQASEDNESWIDIVPFTAPNNKIGAVWSFETNEKIGYKYHRFKFTDKIGGSNVLTLGYPTLTAKILKEGGFNESELVEGVDYDFTEFVQSSEYDYYVDRERFYNFTKRNREYYKYGTELDVTAEGTFARIDDGVASGFTTANYLTYTSDIVTPNTFEQVVKITTGTDVTTAQSITSTSAVGANQSLATIQIYKSFLRIYATQAGSGTNNSLINGVTSSLTVSANTTYWIKYHFDGAEYKVDVSEDGDIYTNYITVANTTLTGFNGKIGIGIDTYKNTTPFLGSVDLKECYLDINDSRWWSGDSYTRVGSWIDEGVVGTFTTANYLVNNKGVFNTKKPWESVISFTTGSDVSTSQVICCNTIGYWGYGVGIQSGKLRVALSSSTSSHNIIENKDAAVLANTKYWVRTVFNGENYTCTYSTDGKNYLEVFSLDSTTTVSSGIPRYGLADSGKTPFLGTIDFSESYIKIDGEFWWRGLGGIGGGTYTATDGWGNVANAFDHISNTYATCATSTDYIEYDFGREVYVNGFIATGQYVSSGSRPMDLRMYSVDANGNEVLLGNGTGSAATSVYTTKVLFTRVKTSKVRFRLTEKNYEGNPPLASVPTRIREIRILGSIIGTESDYDYYIDRHKFYNLIYKPYDVISDTFNISDEIQTYTVPEGVYSLNIFCAASAGYSTTGGNGGAVKCDLAVTPGQTLYVTVGSRPTTYNTAVYNASDIRIGGTEYENRIIVAGGGGTGRSNKGGAGGGLVGGDAVGVGYQKGAFGGTQEAGGGASYRSGGNTDGWAAGAAGTYAMGGNGARGSMYGGTVLGGCGGAGYYGGGGGGVYDINKVGITHAGGGGGSSYTDASLCKNVVHYQGVIKEDGYVRISYIKERAK